ncbi:hypothetical protein RCL1_005155 [Eukaryota sp. TZLM3-RCL]
MRSFIVFLFLLALVLCNSDIGTFFLFNDAHVQPNYVVNSDPDTGCTSGSGTVGMFGDPSCCTPNRLYESALNAMKTIDTSPDFVAFVGDITPNHEVLKHSKWNKQILLDSISDFSSTLSSHFPTTPLLLQLGNHDMYPAHQFGPLGRWVFKETLSLWGKHIPKDQHENYLNGGFYRIDVNEKLTILNINTNFYFTMDVETVPNPDPSHQFKWIRSEMSRLVELNRKAIIFMHVPVGVTESFAVPVPNMQPQFNSRLLDSFEEGIQHDRISAIFSGHEHSAALRLLWNYKDNKPGAPLFISPSMVPFGGSFFPGNNPSFRRIYYNKTDGTVVNYQQYYLNLTRANLIKKDSWELDYDARSFFKVSDMSTTSVWNIYNRFTKDHDFLVDYIKQNAVRSEFEITARALIRHLCAIRHSSNVDFFKCFV